MSPWGVLRTDTGSETILEKDIVFGFEFGAAHLASQENPLPYTGTLTDFQKQVKVGVLGLGGRYFPHPAAHLYAGWDWHHFYSAGNLFESFNRNTYTLEVGVRPLWRTSVFHGLLQSLTISIGVLQGLGPFVAADFGALGPFAADDERKSYVTIGFDFWRHESYVP